MFLFEEFSMNFLVAGASVSAGKGLNLGKKNPNLWVNQFLNQAYSCCLEDICNVSIIGIDNKEIFQNASTELINYDYDVAIVCWQSMPRTNLHFGLETYNTKFPVISPQPAQDINLLQQTRVSASQLSKIQKFLVKYYNHHWDIVDLVNYINILVYLAQAKNTKIFFINYNLPWNKNYFFEKKDWNTPNELDLFTRNVLQSEFRDDSESKHLYQMIHNEYARLGGIQVNNWLNLYSPLRDIQIDSISESDGHPGQASQDVFTAFLSQTYKERFK